MTATVQHPTIPAARAAAGGNWLPAGTLAGEHAALMRDVERRATPILALLDTRVWPHAELGTLVTFLRAAVLRQASDEEVLLYPHDATTAPFAELTAHHVRLHELTSRLDGVRTEPGGPQQVRALLDELLTTLHRHLQDEQTVLAALLEVGTDVPSAAALAAGEQTWPDPDDAPVQILLDALPEAQAVRLCLERVLRLRPGQRAEIHSADRGKLTQVGRWLHNFDLLRYAVARATSDREPILTVTRRIAG